MSVKPNRKESIPALKPGKGKPGKVGRREPGSNSLYCWVRRRHGDSGDFLAIAREERRMLSHLEATWVATEPHEPGGIWRFYDCWRIPIGDTPMATIIAHLRKAGIFDIGYSQQNGKPVGRVIRPSGAGELPAHARSANRRNARYKLVERHNRYPDLFKRLCQILFGSPTVPAGFPSWPQGLPCGTGEIGNSIAMINKLNGRFPQWGEAYNALQYFATEAERLHGVTESYHWQGKLLLMEKWLASQAVSLAAFDRFLSGELAEAQELRAEANRLALLAYKSGRAAKRAAKAAKASAAKPVFVPQNGEPKA